MLIVGDVVLSAKGIIVFSWREDSLILFRAMTWVKKISPKISVTIAWKSNTVFVHLIFIFLI